MNNQFKSITTPTGGHISIGTSELYGDRQLHENLMRIIVKKGFPDITIKFREETVKLTYRWYLMDPSLWHNVTGFKHVSDMFNTYEAIYMADGEV